MSFESFADFLNMGGHALYVWTSYGLGLVVIVASVISPARARRRFFAVETERQKRGASAGAVTRRSADASGSS